MRPGQRRHVLVRGSLLQQVRLAAGLVLMAFAATHFLNHAAGLFGIEAMEAGQTLRFQITRSWPGEIVIALALVTHLALGLVRLAERRTLVMPAWEAFQIASGILVPVLLFDHIAMTHGASRVFGAADYYRPVLAELWPEHAGRQSLLLALVWSHGVIGIHHWLRLVPWYRRAAPLLGAAAVLLPALALAGFLAGGREVALAASPPGARQAMLAAHRWPDAPAMAALAGLALWAKAVFLVATGAALAFPLWHMLRERLLPQVGVTYVGGPSVTGPIGATLLEISRLRRVPHASVCGGRARCSTCRVRLDLGGEALPAPRFAEAVTLGAIGAPEGVRLACQIRPHIPITVTRLVAPGNIAARPATGSMEDDADGMERDLAVMFLDIKGFTALSEKRLAYDVVFLLNRFYREIGAAITSEGGWIDKYMGDGLLAVFGRETGIRAGARAALAAARRIDLALDRLNAELAAEGLGPIGVGIGIHSGAMVVGRIGYGASAAVTVIGATVNTASRLEGLTREKGCQLVVSRAAADAAEWDGKGSAADRVVVRGTSEPVDVLLVASARGMVLEPRPAGA